MKLKILILLMTFSNVSFCMRQEEIDPEIFKELPLETKYKVLVDSLTFHDPRIALRNNLLNDLSTQLRKIHKTVGTGIFGSPYFKNLIAQKIAALIKENYSKEDINYTFSHVGKNHPFVHVHPLMSDVFLADVLLKSGADINSKENEYYGNTLLENSLISRNNKLAKFLVEQGADLSFKINGKNLAEWVKEWNSRLATPDAGGTNIEKIIESKMKEQGLL